jgi:hypothetical protein
MRRIVLATAATLALLVAGSFAPNRAEAITVTTPTGLAAALEGSNLAHDVAYVWRRVCWWTGGGAYYYGGGPYYGRRYYHRRYWW